MTERYHWERLKEAFKRSKQEDEGGKRPLVYIVWAQGRAFINDSQRGSQDRQKETELQPAVEALCGIPPDKQAVGYMVGYASDLINVRFYREEAGKMVGFNLLLSEKDIVWVG